MLNSNQSGNTNHSLVILHATLNACGESGVDFGRQLFQFFASARPALLDFYFLPVFCFFCITFPPPKTVSLKFFQGRSVKGVIVGGAAPRQRAKLNEMYTKFAAATLLHSKFE